MFQPILFYNQQKHKKKNKYYLLFIIILRLVVYNTIISIISTIIEYHKALTQEIYTHYSSEIIINLYNTIKNYRFQITAKHINYLTNEKIIWFEQPKIIFFNKKNVPMWTVSCNQGKLIEKNILDLYGYVYINKIINNKYTESIITKHILVNLIDHSIISNNKTIIHKDYFYSISDQIYVDLKIQTIKLFGKIYTQYEIKKFQ